MPDHAGNPVTSHSGTVLDPAMGPPVRDMQRLTSFAEVVEVLRSRQFEHVLGQRDNRPFLEGTLISLSGEQHFERRRIAALLFSAAANARYQAKVFLPALNAELRKLPRDRKGRVHGDLVQVLQAALSMLSAAVVGLDGLDDDGALQRHMKCTAQISNGVGIEFAERDHKEVIAQALEYVGRFREEFFNPSFAHRSELVKLHQAGQLAREALPLDLITLMLLNREKYESLGPDTMVREALFFNGAAGGVSHAVCNVISSLLRWVEEEPSSRRALLDDPKFVRSAAMEGIRVRPATPYQIRRAVIAHSLTSGRQFAAGEYVMLDLASANRDTSVFGDDAHVFNPHRAPLMRVKPTGLAFSDGPHTCIAMGLSAGDGQNFEPDRSGLLLAILLRLFKLGIAIGGAVDPQRKPDTLRSEFDRFHVSLDAEAVGSTAS